MMLRRRSAALSLVVLLALAAVATPGGATRPDGEIASAAFGSDETPFRAAAVLTRHTKISDTSGGLGGDLQAQNRFGGAVEWIGDIDGDGFDDLAVGQPHNDTGEIDSGAMWILLMAPNGTVRDTVPIAELTNGLTTQLPAGAHFGAAIAALGDIDRDGVPDLAVGAPGMPRDDGAVRGAVLLLRMNVDGTVKSEDIIDEAVLSGLTTGDLQAFGSSIAPIGDVNGDGVLDIAVGDPGDDTAAADAGGVYLLMLAGDGAVAGAQHVTDGTGGLTSALAAGDAFGSSVAAVGDLDGDAMPDVFVGAPGDDTAGPDSGVGHLLHLDSDGTVHTSRLISAADPNLNYDADDLFGESASTLGDIDGDGFTDLAVGAPGSSSTEPNAGQVWVVSLGLNGSVVAADTIDADTAGFATTIDSGDAFGASIAAFGDFDGDGFLDLAVGATGDDDGDPNAGAVHVFDTDYAWTAPPPCATDSDDDGLCDPAEQDLVCATDTTIFAVDQANSLWSIDLGSDAASLIGPLGITGITDIDHAPDGTLYAIGNNNLYSVDEATGAASEITGGVPNSLSLAFDAAGWAYSDDGDRIVRWDPTDPANTSSDVAQLPGATGAGDLAFHRGRLYWATAAGLAAIDPNTGQATMVGSFTGAGAPDNTINSLSVAHDGGSQRLLGGHWQGGTLYAIDLATGGLAVSSTPTTIGNYAGLSAPNDHCEWGLDTDQDGVPNHADPDDDGDGSATVAEHADPNGDGSPRDALDSDRDGEPDYLDTEAGPSWTPATLAQRVSSVVPGENFGRSATGLGDLDGDGVNDIAVGAHLSDVGGTDTGSVYVLRLNADASIASVAKISNSNGMQDALSPGGEFGSAVAGLGDVDGDGIRDIAVGNRLDPTGGPDRGAAWIILLNADGSVKQAQQLAEGTGGIVGIAPGAQFGSGLASLGDLDGDGTPDIAVGAHSDDTATTNGGAAYVIRLHPDGTAKGVEHLHPGVGVIGAGLESSAGISLGHGLAGIGDLNADGVPDLLIGAPSDGLGDEGSALLVTLAADGSAIEATRLGNNVGGMNGLDPADHFGLGAAAVGDLDDDGLLEVLVGAPWDDTGGAEAGSVYIVQLGPSAVPVTDVELTVNRTTAAPAIGDEITYEVTVTNNSDAILVIANVDFTWPNGLTYVSDTAGSTVEGNTATVPLFAMSPHQATTFSVVLDSDAATIGDHTVCVEIANSLPPDNVDSTGGSLTGCSPVEDDEAADTVSFGTNDADGDGLTDAEEDIDNDGDPSNDDTDLDGTPNFQDPDDDNDGVLTMFEVIQ